MDSKKVETTVESLQAGPPEAGAAPAEPRHRWYLPIKTVVEWVAALVFLLCVSPILVLLAILVRMTSDGPAIYSQSRVGRNGRGFLMYKLRSMRQDSEAKTGPIWSSATDSRVTKVGRFLRRTHLDELPQLLNVLQGHMSLIGPRPERPELCAVIEKTIPRFRQRLAVRPGLTGLAQTQLPADVALHTVRRKLAYDLYYIQEVNPWLDLRVALSTVLYLISAAFHALGRVLVSGYGAQAEYDSETGELISDQPNEDEPEMPVASR